MKKENGVKIIQTAGYNGARTVFENVPERKKSFTYLNKTCFFLTSKHLLNYFIILYFFFKTIVCKNKFNGEFSQDTETFGNIELNLLKSL